MFYIFLAIVTFVLFIIILSKTLMKNDDSKLITVLSLFAGVIFPISLGLLLLGLMIIPISKLLDKIRGEV